MTYIYQTVDMSKTEKIVKTKMMLAKVKSANKQGIKLDSEVLGSGVINRDGVPRLPPDQKVVTNWPVLDLGILPDIKISDWTLSVQGLCQNPKTYQIDDLKKLGETTDTSDFHCVTGWSQYDLKWTGVLFSKIAEDCKIDPKAKYVWIEAFDNYTTNLPLSEALKYDVLVAYTVNDLPLAQQHGGPVRMITPQLWAWKGAKWIKSITFMENDKRGFWEERGYSNSAIPWLNDRYTADEPNE
jgi:DMSO/TMAO reductase YedYZ molybdopterin-dependent catalytic subunit